ncbi:uncharacterized protein LOC103385824 [Cynoglossus semilaevis]|uniref:uncharacterized protein LOC103385824 n=1 Tax=Cynoglossus semilaevis TaxID=244447 RepID=UPI0004976414|nr:uncharacterized protein LOC103385824 [Cynoglossus semilaevis]
MLRRESDSHDPFLSGEMLADDCVVGASCVVVDVSCLCQAGPCTLYPEAHTPPTPGMPLCEHCGKNRGKMVTRYSEGYGTEEECLLSDPQGESDADADIEDTDGRLHESGSLQRISSRRRKRPRVARQDTTESEDDGGKNHKPQRWNLRLSPDRAHSRTILEESISQVRPLIICRPNVEGQKTSVDVPGSSKSTSPWSSTCSLPLFLLFLSLPLIFFLFFLILSFLLPEIIM